MEKETGIVEIPDFIPLRSNVISHNRAVKYFDITDADINLGLRHVKAIVKKQYRKLAKKYHPDTNGYKKATYFKELQDLHKRVAALQIMPLTIDNLETVLDLTKGYKSTHDVILPWE